MSTDRISTIILEDFVTKVRSCSRSGQKNINIPISEAENISYHLSLVLLRLLDKQQDRDIKNTAEQEIITVNMDGGGFEEKR
jgi:hypothetical protein